MGGLFSKPKTPEPPKPAPPIAVPQKGETEATTVNRGIKAGRGGTILTGQLSPENVKKKKVLGG